MRQAGIIQEEKSARALVDYLLTQGIPAHLEEEPEGWVVWIYDEDHLPRAKKELAAFMKQPDAGRFQGHAPKAQGLRAQTTQRQAQAKKHFVDVRKRWQRASVRNARVTLGLIVVSVAVAVVTGLGKDHGYTAWLTINSFSTDEIKIFWYPGLPDIRSGQVWRLFTPMFVHFGLIHILFNMFWLRDLGTAIELRKGSVFFGSMVAVMAVASNLGQYLASGPMFGGMSGVVYGLFGFIWMKSRYGRGEGFYMPPNLVYIMMGWFLLCLVGIIPHVANTAHAMGLGVGIGFGIWPAKGIKLPPKS